MRPEPTSPRILRQPAHNGDTTPHTHDIQNARAFKSISRYSELQLTENVHLSISNTVPKEQHVLTASVFTAAVVYPRPRLRLACTSRDPWYSPGLWTRVQYGDIFTRKIKYRLRKWLGRSSCVHLRPSTCDRPPVTVLSGPTITPCRTDKSLG